ncbi:DUF4124 domain-containing protein [Massilia sp. Leaf139]|uniref:DUF4124 domain-containing protein n=1 Tax=Massilia sp. Leaf139 TaxID=1736272 RepID=UPI000712E6E2|nr:DUF4124 domain-containing protein [Massilia sp. Leaf139]KQQ96806.1 hypothetical protein ASF77_02075 [Massilia sp. Leaf139]
MKRLAAQLSLVLAAAAATPAVLAGSDILKCVDAGGHVTLTDQPCASGTRATRLVSNAAPAQAVDSEPVPVEAQPVAVQRYEAPPAMLHQQNWRPRVPQRDRPLARDVATLKAARAQLLLIDADRTARPTLATIQ